MPFPSSQRSKPSAPQGKSGSMTNAGPFTPGPKKQEGQIVSSGGNAPCDSQYETGTCAPKD